MAKDEFTSPIGIPFGSSMVGANQELTEEEQVRLNQGGITMGGEPIATGPGLDAPAIDQIPREEGLSRGAPLDTLNEEPGFFNDPNTAPPKPKGGRGGSKGYVETEVSPPIPGELQAAQMAGLARQAQLQQAGLQARGAAYGLEVDLMRDMGALLEKDFEGTVARTRELMATAEREAAAIDDLIEGAKSNRINPGQFFANVGEAGKFGAALAVGAGAVASAFGGGPNVAYQIISKAIDRNVRAQMVNQAHDRAMIAHQTNFVNTIRGLAKDEAQMGHVYRIGLTALAQARLGEIRAASGETMMQLASEQVNAQLYSNLVEAKIKYLQNSKFKLHMGYQGMRQLSQVMSAARAATGAAGQGRQATRGRAPSAIGTGQARPQLTAGRPPSAGGQTAQGDLGSRALAAAQANPQFATMDVDAKANLVAQMVQEEATRTGETPTRENLRGMLAGNPGDPLTNALAKTPASKLRPIGSQGGETFNFGSAKNVFLPFRDAAKWEGRGQTYKDKKIAGMKSLGQQVKLTEDLFDVVGLFSRGKGFTAKMLRRGPDGELLVPIMGTTNETEALSRLNALGQRLANAKRTEKGQDAVRAIAEWAIWESLTSGDPITNLDEFVQIMRNDPNIRQAAVKPFLQFAIDDFISEAATDFVLPDAFYEEANR